MALKETVSAPVTWRSMARASPTASSRRASGLRKDPRSPLCGRAEYGQTTRVRVREATARSRVSTWPRGLDAAFSLVGVGRVLHSLKHGDRSRGHDRRNRVFVYELRVPIAPQQDTKIIEPGDEALEFHPVDQEDRH